MAPPQREAARKYFSKKENSEGQEVLVCNICEYISQADHYHNLRRHVVSKHAGEKEKIEKSEAEESKSTKKRKLAEPKKNNSLLNYGSFKFIKRKITIPFSYEQYVLAHITQVTVDGRPFVCVDDQGLKMFSEPIMTGLNQDHEGFPKMTSYRLRGLVVEHAQKLRNYIGQKLQNKLLSLKMDGGTNSGRKFLGVNVQFREGLKTNDFRLFTLACIEVHEAQTSANLCAELEEIFQSYGIQNSQLYTATTDNGANYVKAVSLLDKENDHEWDSFEVEMEEITENDEEMLAQVFEQLKVTGIRCFEHTFQLAVNDWLKKSSFDTLLNKVREIVKSSKTTSFKKKFSAEGFQKVLPLDCKTRWGTTYIMLDAVITARTAIEALKAEYDSPLSAEEWKKLLLIKEILKPSYDLTVKMQRQDVMLSELHKYWLECMIALKKIDHEWSKSFQSAMTKRGKTLTSDDCFLSNLYLDPRFKRTLSKNHVERITNHLQTVYTAMMSLNISNEVLEHNKPLETKRDEKEGSELDLMLDEIEHSNGSSEDASTQTNALQKELEKYHNEPKENLQRNQLEYWEENSNLYPILSSIVKVLFGVPGTQVSVERLFSSLTFILNPLRKKLQGKILDDILIIRNNYQTFQEMFYNSS